MNRRRLASRLRFGFAERGQCLSRGGRGDTREQPWTTDSAGDYRTVVLLAAAKWSACWRTPEMKKGAGASPLFVIDAPKPETESRFGPGHPGKPILYVDIQRANRMPAMIVPRETLDLIETTAVRFGSCQKGTKLRSASLQNPTEYRRDSPFFGSVQRGATVTGMRVPSSEVDNIDISEFAPRADLSWIFGRFGFSEGQLGSPAPEKSRRKIEQHRPQSEQRPSAGQEEQDG